MSDFLTARGLRSDAHEGESGPGYPADYEARVEALRLATSRPGVEWTAIDAADVAEVYRAFLMGEEKRDADDQ